MSGINILATGMAVPKAKYDNHRMSEFVDTSDEWIVSRTGIKTRYFCEEETCLSLAVDAARAAAVSLENLEGENAVKKVGLIIVATTTPDYIFPSMACMVAKELGIGEDVMAFDMTAACSGFLYALETAGNFLAVNKGKYALVIGAEELSRIMDFTDRSTCVLFGDGAGAVLLSASDHEYMHFSGCRGAFEALNCNGVGQKDQFLHMRGNEVFRFAVTTLKRMLDQILETRRITLSDVDYVICHQANIRIIDHVKKKYPGHESKFFINLDRYGNTSAASIPIAIHELASSEKLQKGVKIICIGFGAGLTWGGTYIEL